jgi:hypothetical protein
MTLLVFFFLYKYTLCALFQMQITRAFSYMSDPVKVCLKSLFYTIYCRGALKFKSIWLAYDDGFIEKSSDWSVSSMTVAWLCINKNDNFFQYFN